jgi:hypothetical protein
VAARLAASQEGLSSMKLVSYDVVVGFYTPTVPTLNHGTKMGYLD